MQKSLLHRSLLSIATLCAAVLPQLASATPTLRMTAIVSPSNTVVPSPTSLAVGDDGTIYMLGTSTTSLAAISADGTSVSTLNYNSALVSASTRKMILSGSTLYIGSTAGLNGTIIRAEISGSDINIVASSGSVTGTINWAMAPLNGNLFITRSATLQAIDRGTMSKTSSVSLAGSALSLASNDDGTVLYYVASTGQLRSVNPAVGSASEVTFASSLGTNLMLARDSNENLYVLTPSTGVLRKYSSGGTLIWSDTKTGSERYGTGAITIKNDYLYTATTGRVVKVFDLRPEKPDVSAEASGDSIQLTWTTPTDSDYQDTTIRRSTTSFPMSVDDGVLVADGLTGTSYDDTGLEWETAYYYTVFHRASGIYSRGGTGSAITGLRAPDAPSLGAFAEGSNAILYWSVPSGAASFLIMQSKDGDDAQTVVMLDASESSYTVEGLTDGTYVFSIYALNADDVASDAGVSPSIVIDTIAPDAPTGFSASTDGSDIALNWTNPALDFEAVRLQRNSEDYPAEPTDGTTVFTNQTFQTYTIHGVTEDTYYFSLFARDAAGNYSLAAHATVIVDSTAPSAPSHFAATADGNDVTLNWTNPTFDFEAVRLQRSPTSHPVSPTDGMTVFANQTFDSYEDSDLTDGTYYYGLFARDAAGNYSVPEWVSVTIDTVTSSSSSSSSSSSLSSSGSAESERASGGGGGGGRGHVTAARSSAPTILRPAASASASSAHAQPIASPLMQERTCKRMTKWVSPARWKIVNARLQKWLGFSCR